MKESIIKNITESYFKSIEDMWQDYVKYIKNIKDICANTPISIKKEKKGNSIIVTQKKNKRNKLCEMIEETKEWNIYITNVSIELTNIPLYSVGFLCKILGENLEFVLNIIDKGVYFATNWLVEKLSNLTINNKWFKKFVKKLKTIILYIKKSIKIAELFIYKITKKVLNFAANNKVTEALSIGYESVFNYIKSISKYIDITLNTINGLLSTIVGFNLEGETMGFFITPKTVMAGFTNPNPYTTMKPLNIEKTIKSNISDEIIEPIKESYRTNKITKSQQNTLKISAQIVENVKKVLSSDEDIELPEIDIEENNEDELSLFLKNINSIILLLAQPEALPKYERLSPNNLGYMMWLITSFVPTMKKCFGLPTFP